MNLAPLFAPRGIAVVGASRDPAKLGAVMLGSLGRFGSPVAGVNPRDTDPAAGRHACVAAAAAAGGLIDLAVLCVPAAACAQALAGTAVAPAPLTAAQAAEPPGQLAGRALLDGFRGAPVTDRIALGTVLGGLLDACPDLEDVEINPLRVTADGLVALDAVLHTRKEA